MADIDTNNEIMEVTSHVAELDRSEESVDVIDGNLGDQVDEGVCEEDILQQAFVEASSFPDGVQIQYIGNGMGLQEANMINPGDEGTTFITTDANGQISTVQLGEQFENGSYQILVSNDASNNQYAEPVVAVPNGTAIQLPQDNSIEQEYAHMDEAGNILKSEAKEENEDELVEQNEFSEISASTSSSDMPQQQTKQIQLTGTDGTAAPLGSSLNPIRIIQQGNQYTPVQQLSTEQLQQIMQVVQQQQITKSLDSGSSVLYNQQTNTRIVYRVIYPSDLHKDGSGDSIGTKGHTIVQTIPKRTYKKKNKEEEQDRIEGPELTKEEKDAKKKQRSKTRSGRVSKPPKHMVKDYKHIHVLDYDEDYDDSDGGYSDYKVGEPMGVEEESRHEDDTYIAPGLNSSKPKNWKCISCEKAYIGRAGLARHLKLYPSHGSMDPEGEGDMEPPPSGTTIVPTAPDDSNPATVLETPNDVNSNPTSMLVTPNGVNSNPVSTPVTPNGVNSAANSMASLSEDSRDSTYSLPYTPTPRPRGQRGRPRGSRSGWRGRGAYSKVNSETKRRNKLKEVARECSDEELMEIVLPRLAKVITLWEFLLMKVEIEGSEGPHADAVYREYETLHHLVKKLCQEYLQYVPEAEQAREDTTAFLQIENSILAQALGLQVGCHRVKDIPDSEEAVTYKYKFLTTNHNTDIEYANRSFLKRTVEVVSPEDIVSPKRSRLSVRSSPVVIPAQNVGSRSTGLDSNSFLANTLTQTPVTGASSSQPRIMKLISPITPASPTVAVSSTNVPSVSTTSVILTNSLPQTPVIIQAPTQVISGMNPGTAPGTNSGRTTGSKAVSLLNNSKYLSSKPESQKILILSGTSPGAQTSLTIPVSSAPQLQPDARGKSNTGLQQIVQTIPSVSSQISTISNLIMGGVGQSTMASSALMLPAALSNSSPMKSETGPQLLTLLPINSSSSHHPIIVSLPQPSQPHMLQSKLVVTEPGGNNPPTVESLISAAQPALNSQNTTVEMLDADQVLNSVENDASFITEDQTYSLNGDVRTENGNLDSENVVYALQNGESDDYSVSIEDSSQTNIVYAVDPEMVLVNKTETDDNISIVTNDLGNSTESSKLLLPGNSEEVVGVLNSIDNTAATTDIKLEHLDTQLSSDCDQVPEQSQMAANADELDQSQADCFSEYQPDMQEADQSEDGQLSATIYQTEDGTFIIQNSDGTTLQLQGTDGQALSMETVQALLAMDGGTELITQQNEVT